MPMTEKHVSHLGAQGFLRVGYTQWGSAHEKNTLVCVPGLTRNARDFDMLASSLDDSYRVACVDLPGRGRSDWLSDPTLYGPPLYAAVMSTVIARLGVEKVDWVGTSLGGIVGMILAAQPNTPIRRLVINDVGPFVPKEALRRINGYVGKDPAFDDVSGIETYLRDVAASFGPLHDDQWRHLAEHSARCCDDGKLRLNYDPAIAVPFQDGVDEDIDLWPVWEAIRCPVLVLRGKESDLLLEETANEMMHRGPRAELVEFDHVGHAPALMDAAQIRAIQDWLMFSSEEG